MGRSRQGQSAYLRTLICELKSHIENLRKIHEEDLMAGFGSVNRPFWKLASIKTQVATPFVFFCNSLARIRLRHPHHTGTSCPQMIYTHVLNRGAGGVIVLWIKCKTYQYPCINLYTFVKVSYTKE